MLRWCAAVGLLVLAGCGGAEEPCTDDVSGTEGVRLTYKAQGGPSEVESAVHTLCRRVEGLGEDRPAVAAEADRITVVVPKGTPDSVVDYLGTQGRLGFYDWEAVLLDDRCRASPDRNALDRSPIVGRERAEKLAARCDARLIRQERTDHRAPLPDAWWIIRGEPELTGDDIVEPGHDTDPQTREPIVVMDFTATGRDRFARLTRAVAVRGADNAIPDVPPQQGAHHFAIILDDQLVSTPFIDYAEHPDGIGGETGAQISGGFSEEGGRVLARVLELGPLPLDLELVERRNQGG